MKNHAQVAELARELANNLTPQESVYRAVEELAQIQRLSVEQTDWLAKTSESSLTGFGVLQPYFDDESIEEIWINRPNEIFVAREGKSERIFVALSSAEIANLVERMLRKSGRRLDRTSPYVDAALPDGSRLHVIIPDLTRDHWSVNIRKFPNRIWHLNDLLDRKVLTLNQSRFLAGQMRIGRNILVSGATQSGKTTMLCALLAAGDITKRLVSVEETFELRAENFDWVALQTRQASIEGKGEVTLRRLVKESLRMRPDLLVVGEVREAESLDLLIAMNSGLPGLCTIHANSAAEAVQKLCTLPLLAGSNISPEFVKVTVAHCIDVVVHCEMLPDGSRRLAELAEVSWNEQTQSVDVLTIKTEQHE